MYRVRFVICFSDDFNEIVAVMLGWGYKNSGVSHKEITSKYGFIDKSEYLYAGYLGSENDKVYVTEGGSGSMDISPNLELNARVEEILSRTNTISQLTRLVSDNKIDCCLIKTNSKFYIEDNCNFW